jgi:hypothetical protein
MEVSPILEAIDTEISRLQHVRALLSGNGNGFIRKQRTLTPEGRAKIIAAQKARWAKAKKAAK